MSYALLADVDLWNLFIAGDKKVLAYIYKKQYHLLFAYGVKFCADEELVSDCIQDLFVKLYTNRKNLNSTVNINTYLIRALKNRIYDEISLPYQIVNIGDLPFDFLADDEFVNRFSETDEEWMQKHKLQKAMEQLASNQREAIYLRFIRELSYEEIGEVLNINYQSAKNLISRSLAKLRELYIHL